MARYVVHYDLRNPAGNGGTVGTKTVEAESEHTAIRIAQDQAQRERPTYTFLLKKVEKRN